MGMQLKIKNQRRTITLCSIRVKKIYLTCFVLCRSNPSLNPNAILSSPDIRQTSHQKPHLKSKGKILNSRLHLLTPPLYLKIYSFMHNKIKIYKT